MTEIPPFGVQFEWLQVAGHIYFRIYFFYPLVHCNNSEIQRSINLNPPRELYTIQTRLHFHQYTYLAHPWHPVVGSSIFVCPGGSLLRGTRQMLTVPNYVISKGVDRFYESEVAVLEAV